MISVESAILKTRRDLALGAVLRWALILAGVLAVLSQSLFERSGMVALGVLLAVVGTWLALSMRSIRGSRAAADSSSLIAAGQFDQAERQIAEVLDSFSILRSTKLMCLHHLAVLRHAQSRWHDSAVLCRAILAPRLAAAASGLDRSSRLILAESLLELNDLPGVHDALSRLYDQRLSLREALNLLAVQLDYLARLGSWDAMLMNLTQKIDLAELLPPEHSARAQGLLALAALKTGRTDWAVWLRRRVELLADVQKLCTERPILWEIWRA